MRYLMLIIVFVATLAFSADNENTHDYYDFSSNLLLSAYGLGQGGASAAHGEGLRGVFVNPASLGKSEELEVSVNSGLLFNYRLVSEAMVDWQGIMVGYGMLQPTISDADAKSDRVDLYIRGLYGARQQYYYLGYGYGIIDWLSAGLTAKMTSFEIKVPAITEAGVVYSDIVNHEVSTYTGSIGVALDFDWLDAGVVLHNVGGSGRSSVNNGDYQEILNVTSVPTAGLALSFTPIYRYRFSMQVDVNGREDAVPTLFKGGLEYMFNSSFRGRIGYDSELSTQGGGGITVGLGALMDNFIIDAAYADGVKLDDSDRYSFSTLLSVTYFIPSPTKHTNEPRVTRDSLYDKQTQAAIVLLRTRAEEYQTKGDLEHARDNYDLILVWYPDDEDTLTRIDAIDEKINQREAAKHVKKCKGFLKEEAYTDAVLEAQLALDLDADNVEALRLLAQAQGAMEEINSKRREDIVELMTASESAYTSGDFSEAIEILTEVVKVDPTNKEAIRAITRAQDRLEEYEDEKLQLARDAATSGDYETAKALYTKVLRANPNSIEAKQGIERCQSERSNRIARLNEEGISYFVKGKYIAAESRFRTVLSLNLADSTARDYLSKIDKARAEKKAPKPTKKDYSNIYQLGVSSYSSRNYSTAIGYWNQIPPGSPFYNKAQININRTRAILSELEG